MNRIEQEFTVDEDLAGRSLAQSLRVRLPGQSWSKVRRLIEGRRVTVSGTLCLDGARRLTIGEPVVLFSDPLPSLPDQQQLRFLYTDRDLVVVDKPAGIITERRRTERNWSAKRRAQQPTLDELVLKRLRAHRLAQRGVTATCVHRLDRDASGTVLIAQNKETALELKTQFQQRTAKRHYSAIAHGAPKLETIESWIADDRGDGQRGSVNRKKGGKRAVTRIISVERFGAVSLVGCELMTGRTHQIRIHLADVGTPVCGDTRYGDAAKDQAVHPPRLALHAAQLGFRHPRTEQWVEVVSNLPAELQDFLHSTR